MYHECIHVSIPNKFLTELILSFWIPNVSSAPSKMISRFLHFQISLASWACTLDAPQTVQSPAILPGTRLEAGLHCRCNIFGFAGFSISNYLIIFIESSFWCSQTLPLSLLLFENFKIRMFQKTENRSQESTWEYQVFKNWPWDKKRLSWRRFDKMVWGTVLKEVVLMIVNIVVDRLVKISNNSYLAVWNYFQKPLEWIKIP